MISNGDSMQVLEDEIAEWEAMVTFVDCTETNIDVHAGCSLEQYCCLHQKDKAICSCLGILVILSVAI
jgi:hypothetical protein